jgi:hypothetical protein
VIRANNPELRGNIALKTYVQHHWLALNKRSQRGFTLKGTSAPKTFKIKTIIFIFSWEEKAGNRTKMFRKSSPKRQNKGTARGAMFL